jgi:hypothetical protein
MNLAAGASMKWFRFYSEVLHDAKIQTLSLELRWAWVSLLCLANDGKPRGTLPPLRDIAFAMRITEAKARKLVDALIAAELIDATPDGGLMPHNWDSRQHKSDDVAERVRKHRERTHETLHVTLHGENGNVTETPRVRAETETDSDSEKEGEEQTPPTRISNRPEDIDRVAAQADKLFPVLDYGIKVRQLEASLRMDWLEAALLRTHEQGKTDWRYAMGVYRGIAADGGIKVKPKGAGNGRASPERPVVAHPVHVAPADSPFRRANEEARRKAMGGGE